MGRAIWIVGLGLGVLLFGSFAAISLVLPFREPPFHVAGLLRWWFAAAWNIFLTAKCWEVFRRRVWGLTVLEQLSKELQEWKPPDFG